MSVSAMSLVGTSVIDSQLDAEEDDHTLDYHIQCSGLADQSRWSGSGLFRIGLPGGLVQVS